MGLTRLRADPTKIRVSIRRTPSGFVVTVAERAGAERVAVGAHRVPRSALYRALLAAAAAGLVGVDMGMEWTYPHPQRRGRSWNEAQRLN